LILPEITSSSQSDQRKYEALPFPLDENEESFVT